MKNLPTDRRLLEEIYRRYVGEFSAFDNRTSERQTKMMVPIDIVAIAEHFGVDNDVIFGRLYYHLQEKHGYRRENGTKVAFFAPGVGEEKYCVNFALLSAVLAGLQERRRSELWALWLSILALIVSVASITTTLLVP